ncbi:MAG: hypothetical protein V1906_00170 [Candidatus Woesearchaeota archaeon]
MFAILGLVIIIVISLAFFFRSQIAEKVSQLEIAKGEKAKQMESDLRSYASSCLKKTAIEGLEMIMAEGGYYDYQGASVDYHAFKVPYYMDERKESVPEVNAIAVSLARYIDDNIDPCIRAYSSSLETGKAKSEVKAGRKVALEVSQKLALSSGETTARLSSYITEIDFDLKDVYAPTLSFYKEARNISSVDFIGQSHMALEGKYRFYIDNVGEQESVFVLFYPGVLEGKNIEWMFAIKYPGQNIGAVNPQEMFA